MKDQILRILETEGLTPAKFADEIRVQRSSISHILSGRNQPSYDFIIKIIDRFKGINAEWLLTGKGLMFKSSGSSDSSAIKQASLFDQQTINEEIYKTNLNKEALVKDESTIKKGNIVEDKFENSILKSKIIKEFTNVNSIKHIVIFYDNNTFEQYLPG